MAIIEGREAIAAYLHMSPATLYRHRKKYSIPVHRGHKGYHRHAILAADTRELDAWKKRQEAKNGRD